MPSGRRRTTTSTLFAIASHVTHCRPVSVVSGTVAAICASCAPRRRRDDARLDGLGGCQFVEIFGERAEPRMVVELGDGDLGEALAQRGHQLRGGQ